jgi:2-haloacid dehalogenase
MLQPSFAGTRALTFDVFGTVVDWRSSIIREGETLSRAKGILVDWERFADAWREGYAPAMARVRRGELPWTNI